MQHDTVDRVLGRHAARLMALPGVVGTGQGSSGGRPCILVLVARRTPELERVIPPDLEGIPVEIRETGTARALGAE